jgi:transitional endoplasmic reticulum ATPase
MNETALEALEVALQSSPDNVALRCMAIRGWLDLGKASRAVALVTIAPSAVADPTARIDCARALRLSGDAARALTFATLDDAASQLERARALAALERLDEARVSYDQAVRANPTLEDANLALTLRSHAPSVVQGRKDAPRLRVISNDATAPDDALRALDAPLPPVRFADVGGLTEIKAEIHRRIVLPFQKPSLFDRFRKRVGGGVLLYGAPGCGKTLLARATAGECNAKFISVAISDVLDMYIGESERKLHALFEQARQSTPAVLFFDELEALAGKRKASRDGVSAKVVSHFLSEMDGFAQNNRGVLILGATNVPWEIDSAFRRPGRFDRVLFVPPPDREARASILKLHLAQRPAAADVNLAPLAQGTSGFSGADLEFIIETAADYAIADSIDAGSEMPITNAHLVRALKDVRPTTIEWLSSARNYARYANEGGQYDEVLAFLAKNQKP